MAINLDDLKKRAKELRKKIKNIETVIDEKITGDVKSYEIEGNGSGRKVETNSIGDLLKVKVAYQKELASVSEQMKKAQGRPIIKTHRIRFDR